MRSGNYRDLYKHTARAVMLACVVGGCATGADDRQRANTVVDGMAASDAAEAALIAQSGSADPDQVAGEGPPGSGAADAPGQQVAVAGLDSGFGEAETGGEPRLSPLVDVPQPAAPATQDQAADVPPEPPVSDLSGTELLAESGLVLCQCNNVG